MKRPRIFRMTVANIWYDKEERKPVGYEMHYKVSRRGKIRNIRKQLVQRGIQHFQQNVYRHAGRWIPKYKIRIDFEREEPSQKSERDMNIAVRKMERQRRQWKGIPLPSR